MQQKKPHFSLRWREAFSFAHERTIIPGKKGVVEVWKVQKHSLSENCDEAVTDTSHNIQESLSYLQVTIVFTCSFAEENANL